MGGQKAVYLYALINSPALFYPINPVRIPLNRKENSFKNNNIKTMTMYIYMRAVQVESGTFGDKI